MGFVFLYPAKEDVLYYHHLGMKYFVAIIMMCVGFGIVWKTEGMLRTFGRVDWAEAHLQIYGGTRMFYKLVGILLLLIGMLIVTGLGGGVASTILLPLFGLKS